MVSRNVLEKLAGKLVIVFTDDRIARWKGWLSREFDDKSIKLTSRKNEKVSKSSCYIDLNRVIAIRKIQIRRKKVIQENEGETPASSDVEKPSEGAGEKAE